MRRRGVQLGEINGLRSSGGFRPWESVVAGSRVARALGLGAQVECRGFVGRGGQPTAAAPPLRYGRVAGARPPVRRRAARAPVQRGRAVVLQRAAATRCCAGQPRVRRRAARARVQPRRDVVAVRTVGLGADVPHAPGPGRERLAAAAGAPTPHRRHHAEVVVHFACKIGRR